MILKELKLHNIRSYTTQRIEFPKGVILLAGDIGSGKSTILLATEFALFGLLRGMVTGESLLRKGKNQGFVELSIEIDGKQYTIHRALKRSKTSVVQDHGFMVFDDLRQDMTASEMKSRVLELLGYPKELITKSKSLVFRYTVYTPQEHMKHILFENKEARLDTLRRVFDIDKYKRVTENTNLYLKTLRQRKRGHQERLKEADTIANLKKQKEEELFDIGRQLDSIVPLVEEITLLVQEKQNQSKEAEQKWHQTIEINAQEKSLQEKLIQIRESLQTNQEKSKQLNQSLLAQEEQVKVLYQIPNVEDELAHKKQELERITQLKEKSNQEFNEAEKTLVEIRNKSSLATYHIREKEKSIQELSSKITNLQEVVNVKVELIQESPEQISARIESVESERKKTQLRKQQVLQEQATIATKLESSSKITKKLEDIDECPLCMQSVSSEYKTRIASKEEHEQHKLKAEQELHNTALKELSEKENRYQEQYTLLQKQLTKSQLQQLEVKEKNKAKQELGMIQEQIVQHQQEASMWTKQKEESALQAESIKANVQRVLKENQQAQQRQKEIQQKVEELNKIFTQQKVAEQQQQRIKEYKQQIEELQESSNQLLKQQQELEIAHKGIKDTLKAMGNPEAEYAMIKKELQLLQIQQKQSETQKTILQTRQKDMSDAIKHIMQDLKRFDEIKQEFKTTNKMQRWLEEFFLKVVSNIERHVMQSVHTQFNELFQKWFGMLMEQELIHARLDETFTPVIEQNGYETNISSLSGGEKTAAALAYRLALNKVINEFVGSIRTRDLIALDEPTDGFSSEQLDKMREVLDELYLKQIIIVSHESKIESFVDHVMRVHKEEHVSRVVV